MKTEIEGHPPTSRNRGTTASQGGQMSEIESQRSADQPPSVLALRRAGEVTSA